VAQRLRRALGKRMGAIPRGFESRLLRLRAIFLNSWFGKVGKPFLDFIKEQSSKTDIFCFMEFTPEITKKVSKILPEHRGFMEKGMFLESFSVIDCQVIFVKKSFEVVSSGSINLYENTPEDIGFASYIILKKSVSTINLLNVHGKVIPGDKNDTSIRLKQSEIIIDFMKDKEGPKIIGGDFNLIPDTKSVAMFEEAGYRNLIKDFNIKNTRNEISWKQFQDKPGYIKQHFADYVFVSRDVKVNKFDVPYIEISDHLPLILDFEI
jgi:hypothetical protein